MIWEWNGVDFLRSAGRNNQILSILQAYIAPVQLQMDAKTTISGRELPEGVLYMHSFKTHFHCHLLATSMHYLQQHMCIILLRLNNLLSLSHSSQASLASTSAWIAFKWPIFPWKADIRLWITTRLADEFGHLFSCFVWHVEVKMAPMEIIWLFLVKM